MKNQLGIAVLSVMVWGSVAVQGTEVSGNYQLSYQNTSLGAAWFNGHADKSTAGNQFDDSIYEKVPVLAEIKVNYDAAGLKATVTGGGDASTRNCTQKNASDNLTCNLFNTKLGQEVTKGCHESTAESELLNLANNQVAYYARVSYHLFIGNSAACALYKETLGKAIQAKAASPFWLALTDSGAIKDLDKLEDSFALANIYQATKP